MKNPLNKRLPRELKGDIGKYIENAIPYKEPVGGINLAYV